MFSPETNFEAEIDSHLGGDWPCWDDRHVPHWDGCWLGRKKSWSREFWNHQPLHLPTDKTSQSDNPITKRPSLNFSAMVSLALWSMIIHWRKKPKPSISKHISARFWAEHAQGCRGSFSHWGQKRRNCTKSSFESSDTYPVEKWYWICFRFLSPENRGLRRALARTGQARDARCQVPASLGQPTNQPSSISVDIIIRKRGSIAASVRLKCLTAAIAINDGIPIPIRDYFSLNTSITCVLTAISQYPNPGISNL